MLTVGGAISGYSAIGRKFSEINPRIVMIIETTEAKIGRSMKKWLRRIGLLGSGILDQFWAVFSALMVPFVGATFVPGRIAGFATPSMTTRSSALSPFSIMRRPSCILPGVTDVATMTLSALTV